jgi:hypothetical protein
MHELQKKYIHTYIYIYIYIMWQHKFFENRVVIIRFWQYIEVSFATGESLPYKMNSLLLFHKRRQ